MIREHSAGFSRTDFWFPGKYGHVRRKSVSATLSQAFKRANIAHTGHNLRAWYITEQLEAGADSNTVRHNARHTDDQSLKKYDKPSDRRLSAAQELLPRVAVPIKSGRRRAIDSRPLAA
jgi:site-specific recombinase XerD